MTMEKRELWILVHCTCYRTTGKLKVGLAVFVGDMLTDDSWCALGDGNSTKSVGKKHSFLSDYSTSYKYAGTISGYFLWRSCCAH